MFIVRVNIVVSLIPVVASSGKLFSLIQYCLHCVILEIFDSNLHSPMCPCALHVDCAESVWVYVHSAQTVQSPSQSMQTLHTLDTLHKNCTMEESNHSGTNSTCWTRALPLCHCGLLYIDNLCYMCNLWPNWEICLLLFNMGHMIYVLDQFFNVNSMVVSILWSD